MNLESLQSARVQEHLRKGGQAVFHGRVDIVGHGVMLNLPLLPITFKNHILG